MGSKPYNVLSKGVLASLMLATAIVPVIAVGVPVVEAADSDFAGGTGTVANPYLVSTPAQLFNVGKTSKMNFKMVNDIDLQGQLWVPIGGVAAKETTFDGGGHKIEGLKSRGATAGLFSSISGEVKNLNLVDVDIEGTSYAGALSPSNVSGKINNVTVTGTVKALQATAAGGAGGLVYGLLGTGAITNSSTDVIVETTGIAGGLVASMGYATSGVTTSIPTITKSYVLGDVIGGIYTGGLVGRTDGSTISEVYVTGDVKGGRSVGGIVGYAMGTKTTKISDSFTAGNTVVGTDSYVGGIVGYITTNSNLIHRVYSTSKVSGLKEVGGLVGSFPASYLKLEGGFALNQEIEVLSGTSFGAIAGYTTDYTKASLKNIYMDADLVGRLASGGGFTNSALTVTKDSAREQETYEIANFNFGSWGAPNPVWGIDEGSTLPYLLFEPLRLVWDGATGGYVNKPATPDPIDKPTITPDTTEPGAESVKVTLVDPPGVPGITKREYKIDDGEWQEYTAPITITKNCLIEGRVTNSTGISPIGTLRVFNIGSEGTAGDTENDSQTATLNLEAGYLTLAVSDPESFGTTKLSNQPQHISKGFVDAFEVTDLRGTGAGWRLDVSASNFKEVEPVDGFKAGTGGYALPTGSLLLSSMETIVRTEGSPGGDPSIGNIDNVVIDGSSLATVSTANTGEGAGKFELSYGSDALTLVVDSSTAKVDTENYVGVSTPYESTITWDLVSAP